MEIRTRRLRVGSIELHVAEAGPKDGPLVILLHGFPEFWFEWRDLIGPLAHAGFRVVAPDQRGYHLSDTPAPVIAYRLDVLAQDIFALTEALGSPRFQVVGHDWGASVAWWMATTNAAPLDRLARSDAHSMGRSRCFCERAARGGERGAQRVEVVHFPRAGHWLPHHEPEAVRERLLGFLRP